MEVRDRLCEGSGAALARRLAKSDSYVARMLYPPDKKGFKRIGEDTVDAIDAAFNWPPGFFDSDELIYEHTHEAYVPETRNSEQKGDVIGYTKAVHGRSLQDRNVEPGPEIKGKLPLISWAMAGTWETGLKNFEPSDVEEWLLSPIETSTGAYFLRVRGQSMYNPDAEPSFRENDLVLVEPTAQAEHGSLVVVRMEGQDEATFKQLIIEDGNSYLKALNPAWPQRIVQVDVRAKICGVVKFKMVRY